MRLINMTESHRADTLPKHFALLALLVVSWLSPIFPQEAHADPYFNSAEPGCDGSNPNVLWCDDFEDGDWGHTYESTALATNDGWVMTPFGPGCGGGCTSGRALVGSPTNGALCGGSGVAGTNCTGSSGSRSGAGQAPFMGDHGFSGQQSVTEFYFRYYLKDLPGSVIGQEKMFTVNPCCAGVGGVKFANHFTWPGSRIIQVTVTAEDANRILNVSDVGALTIGHWWYIEYHLKLNTPGVANGIWEAWVNDCGANGTSCSGTPTLRARHTNVMWRNTGDNSLVGSLWLENWANPGGSGVTYYDQIKASKAGPIGFVGGGGSSITRPESPTNLQVK